MIRILSLDPGITTGYSLGILYGGEFLLSCDQAKLSHMQLNDMLIDWKPNFVVCESFEFRNKVEDGTVLYSCELIGVVHLYHQLQVNVVQLIMQTASQGKGHFNDTKLKKMNLYVESRSHGRDAVRHLMHWFTFGSGFQFNKKQTPMLARAETILNKGDN